MMTSTQEKLWKSVPQRSSKPRGRARRTDAAFREVRDVKQRLETNDNPELRSEFHSKLITLHELVSPKKSHGSIRVERERSGSRTEDVVCWSSSTKDFDDLRHNDYFSASVDELASRRGILKKKNERNYCVVNLSKDPSDFYVVRVDNDGTKQQKQIQRYGLKNHFNESDSDDNYDDDKAFHETNDSESYRFDPRRSQFSKTVYDMDDIHQQNSQFKETTRQLDNGSHHSGGSNKQNSDISGRHSPFTGRSEDRHTKHQEERSSMYMNSPFKVQNNERERVNSKDLLSNGRSKTAKKNHHTDQRAGMEYLEKNLHYNTPSKRRGERNLQGSQNEETEAFDVRNTTYQIEGKPKRRNKGSIRDREDMTRREDVLSKNTEMSDDVLQLLAERFETRSREKRLRHQVEDIKRTLQERVLNSSSVSAEILLLPCVCGPSC